jgi:predicted nucleic acid-binding protein
VSQTAAFWDASALVPLCVDEVTSRQAQSHLRAFMPVVWWGSLVEVHSAIARLNRQGQLNDVEKKGALLRLNVLCQGWREILPDDNLRDVATRLLEIHDLRGADSLQLGAALTWCRQHPAKRNFICGDQRLSKAAAAVGFSITELSRRVS